MTAGELRALLAASLPPAAVSWLEESRTQIKSRPAAIRELFPAAGRRCGRGPLAIVDDGFRGWTVDDAVRCLLLGALPYPGTQLLATMGELYANGAAAERRGVLRALTLLRHCPDVGDAAVPIVTDALRTNDPRLISAALGEYAATHLGAAEYRQAVLKCVFCGIPLADVAGLPARADAELRLLWPAAKGNPALGPVR